MAKPIGAPSRINTISSTSNTSVIMRLTLCLRTDDSLRHQVRGACERIEAASRSIACQLIDIVSDDNLVWTDICETRCP